MSILQHFKSLTLTKDQENALIKIEDYLQDTNHVFLLKGYAGTGKTTIIKGICDYFKVTDKPIRLMAPTGRAAMILNQKTNISASTIHRGIYNMEKIVEYEDDESSFKLSYQLKENKDSDHCIYIIDEASMISDVESDDEFFVFGSGKLLQDLIVYSSILHSNRKILIVGDDAQLPPVNMNFSPALDSEYLEKHYLIKSNEYLLTDVIRQESESAILNTATKIRQSISLNSFNNFEIDYSKNDVQKIAPQNVLEQYINLQKEPDLISSIIITHSNRQALLYNQEIREHYFNNRIDVVHENDLLLITKNNYRGAIELYNGMLVRVLEVGEIVYTATPKFIIKGGKSIQRELKFREVKVQLIGVNGEITVLKTTLIDNFLFEENGQLHPYDQRALYIDFKERMNKLGVKQKSDRFNEELRNDLYFNALQAKFGYAITCHKAQGGEWENVFVDFKVFMGRYSKSFFRWTYTAITRSTSKLFCIDAPNYNSLNQFIIRDIEQINSVLPGSYYIPVNNENSMYFVTYRQNRILEICKEKDIKTEVTSHNNQLLINFMRDENNAKVQLWYSNSGFSKVNWTINNNESFKTTIEEILIDSLLPNEIPFKEKFEFQKDLHYYFLSILKEENISLTNIVQNEWNDQYFIYTGASCALIEFWFNAKFYYTYAKPKSTMGINDEKLKQIIAALKQS